MQNRKVLDLLNSMRASFIGVFAKLVNDLSYRPAPLELVLYDLGGVLTKLSYVLNYALEHGKFEEAKDLLAGVELAIDKFLVGELDLAGFHNRVDDLIVELFGSYPGLCFVFGDYKNCKCPKCGE